MYLTFAIVVINDGAFDHVVVINVVIDVASVIVVSIDCFIVSNATIDLINSKAISIAAG